MSKYRARHEPPLSISEQKAQALRCGCRGSDDYCGCQNVPDRVTRQYRAAEAVAAVIFTAARADERERANV